MRVVLGVFLPNNFSFIDLLMLWKFLKFNLSQSNNSDCNIYFHSAHLFRKVYFNNNHILEERLVWVIERLNLTNNVNLRQRTLMFTAFKSVLSGVLLLMIMYFPFLIENLRFQFLIRTGKNILEKRET